MRHTRIHWRRTAWRGGALATALSVACVLATSAAPPAPPAAPPGSVPASAAERPVLKIQFGLVEPPVILQKDMTTMAPTANKRTDLRGLECSGLVWLEGRLWMLSDRHEHALFAAGIDLDKAEVEEPHPEILIRNDQELLEDGECLTVRPEPQGGGMLYALSSLSNDRTETASARRRNFLRCPVDRAGRIDLPQVKILSASTVREQVARQLTALGVRPYRAFYTSPAGPGRNTYRWGNVEGMTFVPDSDLLLLGMRNPQAAGRAILFVVGGVDAAFDSDDPERMKVQDIFLLDLGGRGVADLCWDPLTKGYLIAAARSSGPKLNADQPYPPVSTDSALFWWSGRKSQAPVLFAKVADMNIEAICRVGASRYIAIGSDENDESEGRVGRQSVLTVLEFTGLP